MADSWMIKNIEMHMELGATRSEATRLSWLSYRALNLALSAEKELEETGKINSNHPYKKLLWVERAILRSELRSE